MYITFRESCTVLSFSHTLTLSPSPALSPSLVLFLSPLQSRLYITQESDNKTNRGVIEGLNYFLLTSANNYKCYVFKIVGYKCVAASALQHQKLQNDLMSISTRLALYYVYRITLYVYIIIYKFSETVWCRKIGDGIEKFRKIPHYKYAWTERINSGLNFFPFIVSEHVRTWKMNLDSFFPSIFQSSETIRSEFCGKLSITEKFYGASR